MEETAPQPQLQPNKTKKTQTRNKNQKKQPLKTQCLQETYNNNQKKN